MSMNNENPQILQLRKAWHDMGKALDTQTPKSNPGNLNNMNTSLDKLRQRYLRGGIASIFATLFFTPLLFNARFIPDSYLWPVAISFAILLLTLGGFIFWMRKGVGNINPLTMTVNQVSELARHYRKCHLRFVCIGFPLAVCWVVFFVFATLQSDTHIPIEGIICGAAIGALCGFKALRKFLTNYQQLL